MTLHPVPWLAALFLAGPSSLLAADAISPGTLALDAPTLCCLGLRIPITGDDDGDASATLEYRLLGESHWRPGLPPLRVKPEQTSTETTPGGYGLPLPERGFAGSVFGLAPEPPTSCASPSRIRTAVAACRRQWPALRGCPGRSP